jgi:hypothetical protein
MHLSVWNSQSTPETSLGTVTPVELWFGRTAGRSVPQRWFVALVTSLMRLKSQFEVLKQSEIRPT